MPRYHFHIHDGVSEPDLEGLELPSKHAAWSEAVRACGEMLKDIDGQLPAGREWMMEVTDGRGQTVFTLRFVGSEHGPKTAANSN